MKYDGKDQKPLLTKKAKEVGAKIMNKTIMHQLLTNKDGAVIGAIGINVANEVPELVIFQTKAVIITTGNALRLRFELEDRPAPDRAASPAPERRPAAGLGAPAPADDYVTIGGGRA